VELLKLVVGIDEWPKLEPSPRNDGYDEMRREIKHLLATAEAMVALLPRPE